MLLLASFEMSGRSGLNVCLTFAVATSMKTRSRWFFTTSVLPLSVRVRSTGRPGKVICWPAD